MQSFKQLNIALWIVQGFLALFFALASGAPKLFLPVEVLASNMPIPLPHLFVQFIGLAEVLGAIGLILPGVTRIRTGLIPSAAVGLVIVTLSATVYQLAARQPESAIFALVMALLAAFLAYGRGRVAPIRERSSQLNSLASTPEEHVLSVS
jgi:hypothetical protein